MQFRHFQLIFILDTPISEHTNYEDHIFPLSNHYTMMLVDTLNVDNTLVRNLDCEDDPDFRQSRYCRGVRKHPQADDSYSQFTKPPAKKIRPSPQRMSCKARGLSSMHNADNAYFEIPIDAPHGLPLSCSHSECASSGRRFRYCQGKQYAIARMQRSL